jgi:hypothetical protein
VLHSASNIGVIRALCKREPEILIMLDEVTKKTLNDHGGDRSNITRNLAPKLGNSREYIVARLERDGHADIAQPENIY